MAPSEPDKSFGENKLIYCGTKEEFNPTATPNTNLAAYKKGNEMINQSPHPKIPMQSVIIMDYLIVNDDNIGPEEMAPNAAPMAGKALSTPLMTFTYGLSANSN